MLTALSSHYWRPDFSPAQAALLIVDYCRDLADCTLLELDAAIADYRRGQEKFFPKIGDLRALVFASRKDFRDMERVGKRAIPEFGDSRPALWWMQAPYLRRSPWRVEDIPAEHRAAFNARLAAKRKAGTEGWGENDFYGLERKHADQQGQGKTR